MLAAAALMVLHLGAFFQADDIIMREIPGSHPYLSGLGILGGMYSFDNPLQGKHLCQHSLAVAAKLLPHLELCQALQIRAVPSA